MTKDVLDKTDPEILRELEHLNGLVNAHQTTPVEIVKQIKMSSAHQLPYQGYPEQAGTGKCTRMHGHTYVVEVGVKGIPRPIKEHDPESGMVVDFGRINDFLKWLHEKFWDHYYLNDSFESYPTAERLTIDIALMAKVMLEPQLTRAWVSVVRVYEEYVEPKAWAEVRFKGAGWTIQ